MTFETEPPFLADVTGLPCYVVDTVVRRDLGNGMVSVINCRKMGGVIIPVCEVVIAAAHLLPIGMSACDFAMELARRQQMAPLHALRMDGIAH